MSTEAIKQSYYELPMHKEDDFSVFDTGKLRKRNPRALDGSPT